MLTLDLCFSRAYRTPFRTGVRDWIVHNGISLLVLPPAYVRAAVGAGLDLCVGKAVLRLRRLANATCEPATIWLAERSRRAGGGSTTTGHNR